MNTHKPNRSGAFRSAATWAGTAALALGGLFGASGAFAAPAPANTLIGNQAVAGYVDSTGNPQSASSNLVQTKVQQVGSFTLVNDNTLMAAGGGTVYASHTLTNTGNGTDSFSLTISNQAGGYTFTKVEIYADNGVGGPASTTPLCSMTAGSTVVCPISQAVSGNGGTFKFLVAYSVPAGTANNASANATVQATAATTALYVVGQTVHTNLDTVKVTTDAAFSLVKSLSAPAVPSAQSGGAWPVNVSGARSSSASCPVAGTGPYVTTSTCQYTTYTLTYKNTGGAAGPFYMQDTLPTGFTYVTGTAVWSSAGGTAMGEGSGSDPVGIDFVQAGQSLSALVSSVTPNVSGSVSFVVLVNNAATVGTGLTTNTASYDSTASTKPAAVATTIGSTNSNPASFLVTASYGVVLGDAAATNLTGADATAGNADGSADLNPAGSVTTGGTVKFTQQLFNTGNASDTFNLTVSTTLANSFPAGTTFTFYAVDGVTPLLDTNGDGIVDGGVMALGAQRTIVLAATIPGSTPAGTVSFTVGILATSVGDSTKKDASRDIVTAVVGIAVDLTNSVGGTGSGSVDHGDLGAGPSPQPTTTINTSPGTGVIFTLFVKNNDSKANSYNLSASQSSVFPGSLPAGWTVKFVAANATCAGTAITNTGTVAATTGQVQVDACVTPPASAPIGVITNIYFNVSSVLTSSAGVIVSDSKTDAVNVNAAALTYSATLTPDNVGQVAAGGTVVYAHTLTATGAQACGTYTLTATQTGSTSGWTYAFFLDTNSNGVIDAGDTPVTSATSNTALPAGGQQKILVRVFAPGGATPGLNDTVVVTATFAAANGGTCNAPTANDVSTVVTGQIRVVKTQALQPGCTGTVGSYSAAQITGKPSDCVFYKVVATNEGTAPITNLSINDAVPPYTTLAVTQPSPQCTPSATGIGGTIAPAYVGLAGASTVSCGSTANTVAPGATLELDFAVTITP